MYQINKPIEFAGDMAVKAGDFAGDVAIKAGDMALKAGDMAMQATVKATKPVTNQVFEPFVDSRREAGSLKTVGESTPKKVAICYNSITTSPKKIKKLASDACKKTKKVAVFSYQDEFSCSILMPTRAYFNCVSK